MQQPKFVDLQLRQRDKYHIFWNVAENLTQHMENNLLEQEEFKKKEFL